MLAHSTAGWLTGGWVQPQAAARAPHEARRYVMPGGGRCGSSRMGHDQGTINFKVTCYPTSVSVTIACRYKARSGVVSRAG